MKPLTIDELASRAGLSVRNVRFYAERGLIPAPERRGRVAYYGETHLARLELVRDLQQHGYTLAAIERYLHRIPGSATPEEIALHRTVLSPWLQDTAEVLSRHAVERRAGRALTDDMVRALLDMGVLEHTEAPDCYRTSTALLQLSVPLLDMDIPLDALRRAAEVMESHAAAIADEVAELFRTALWQPYLRGERSGDVAEMRALVERMRPLIVQALVTAFQKASDRAILRRAVPQR